MARHGAAGPRPQDSRYSCASEARRQGPALAEHGAVGRGRAPVAGLQVRVRERGGLLVVGLELLAQRQHRRRVVGLARHLNRARITFEYFQNNWLIDVES